MSRLAVAVALALSACAGPDAYEKGVTPAVRPPPTSYTPAGAGAHTPGHRRPSARGPVLPDSERDAHPTIRAANNPDEARRVAARMEAPPATPKGTTDAVWGQCWADVQQCLLTDPRGLRADEDAYRCLRRMLAAECGAAVTDRAEQGHPETLGRYGSRGPYDVAEFYRATRGETAKACAQVDRTGEAFNEIFKGLRPKCARAWAVAL